MNSICRVKQRLTALAASIFGFGALCGAALSADISIQHAWALATPPKATVGNAFMTIVNTSTEIEHLRSATVDGARSAEISGIRMADSVANMRQLVNVDIPAGGSIEFKPGFYHITLRNLQNPLAPGQTLKGTLTFERAGVIPVDYTVEAADPSPRPAP